MRGVLKITYMDGKDEYYEVDPVGDAPDFVGNLKAFLESPDVTLILDNEILIIPSTSIRQISITRTDAPLPESELEQIPGVLVGASRIVG
jgi:hypothetical protein